MADRGIPALALPVGEASPGGIDLELVLVAVIPGLTLVDHASVVTVAADPDVVGRRTVGQAVEDQGSRLFDRDPSLCGYGPPLDIRLEDASTRSVNRVLILPVGSRELDFVLKPPVVAVKAHPHALRLIDTCILEGDPRSLVLANRGI